MNTETELKYLVNKLPLNYDRKLEIVQIYFNPKGKKKIIKKIFEGIDLDTITTFRVRKIVENKEVKFVITLKTKSLDGYSREEYEKEITKEVYDSLIEKSIDSMILKNRYIIDKDNYNFEFDEYLNLSINLLTVEVELSSSINDDIIKEKEKIENILSNEFNLDILDVSKDSKYKNSNLHKYF